MQRDRTTTYKIVSYTIFLIVLYLLETVFQALSSLLHR